MIPAPRIMLTIFSSGMMSSVEQTGCIKPMRIDRTVMPNRVRMVNVRSTMRNAITSRRKLTAYMVTATGITNGK